MICNKILSVSETMQSSNVNNVVEAGALALDDRQLPAAPRLGAPAIRCSEARAHQKFGKSALVISSSRFSLQHQITPHIIFTMVAPEVTLTHLNRADGSATYTHDGYAIIGAVNGPIEVQRRDEQPEEATLEVNVRPSAGVGSKL
jgi:hypothetical protein